MMLSRAAVQSVNTGDADSSGCTCDKVTAADIPGAILRRTPEKCKVSELRVWLKSRSQRVKTKETKSELVLRVKKCLELNENIQLVDPYTGQPYLAKLKANCSSCRQPEIVTGNDKITTCGTKEWTQETTSLPKAFSYEDILDYAKRSGKNTNYVEKPIERGYAFFHDGYVFGQAVCTSQYSATVRAKCYRSMKKSESPHSLTVSIDNKGRVDGGKCSCVAGASGHCNHVYALLYSVDHTLKLKMDSFPRSKTCTDKQAEWSKCRADGVRSEPVMCSTVIKPRYGTASKGIKSTLYEARAGVAKRNVELSASTRETLSKINPLLGACLTVNNTTECIDTKMGFQVPKGSALSYQISVTEGDFLVCENTDVSVCSVKENESGQVPLFPWKDTDVQENVPAHDLELLNIDIDKDQANKIFEETKQQSQSNYWFEVRKYRLTASKFGQIMKRKNDKQHFVQQNLMKRTDLGHVPSVKFGRDNENRAKQSYCEFMRNTNRPCKMLNLGCMINPMFPWLAATPDGIVCHKDVGFGLIEVKCSYSKRNVTPLDACKDPSFFCHVVNGKVHLKEDHDYYAQVQGQLGVCGASYCDFIVFTNKGLSIQRIAFDQDYWARMTEKLTTFFCNYFVPAVKIMNTVNN